MLEGLLSSVSSVPASSLVTVLLEETVSSVLEEGASLSFVIV